MDTASRIDEPRECLVALAREYVHFAFRHQSLWSLVFEQPRTYQLPAWYSEKVSRMFSPIETVFRRLTPAKSAEEIHDAARALWSGVHGACVLAITDRVYGKSTTAAEKPATLLVETFIAGFTAEDTTTPPTRRPRRPR
jgi:hypothetical protein